jgi:predicted transcriptional regulator
VDLFNLPAAEYKAAIYLLQRADDRLQVSAGKTDLAEALQVSPASAARVLAALIDKGLIERVRRGRYMVMPQPSDPGESLTSETSSLTHETSSLIRAAETAIEVMTNTTSRKTNDSSYPLLPSNEGNKALRAKNKQRNEKKPVPIYSENDDDLAVYGETRDETESRRQKRSTPRKQHRRASDFASKPRDEWTPYDAASYFAASIETKNLRLWARVSVGEISAVLNLWMKERPDVTMAEILPILDAYLDDTDALDRLERDPRPGRHFLQYLKRTPRVLPRDAEFEAELIRKTEEHNRRRAERATT